MKCQIFSLYIVFPIFFSDFWIEKAVTRANKHNHSPRCAIYVTKHRRDLTRRNPFKNEYAKFISTIRFDNGVKSLLNLHLFATV